MDAKLKVVSLWSEDIPETAHFYRDVLGLQLMPHHGDRPHFDLGDIYLVLVQGKPTVRVEGSPDYFPVLAFAVNNLDESIAQLRNHDVELPWDVVDGKGTRWIMFRDPAGNLIELVEYTS